MRTWCGAVLLLVFVFVNGRELTGESVDHVDFRDIIPECYKVCRTTDRNWWQLIESLGFGCTGIYSQSLNNVTRSLEVIQYSHGNLSTKVDSFNNTVYDLAKSMYDRQQQHFQDVISSLTGHDNKTDEIIKRLPDVHLDLLTSFKSGTSTIVHKTEQISTEILNYSNILTEGLDRNHKYQQSEFEGLTSVLNKNKDNLQNNFDKLNNVIQTAHETILGQIQKTNSHLQQIDENLASYVRQLAGETGGLSVKLSEQISSSNKKLSDQHERDFKDFKVEIQNKLTEVDSSIQKTNTDLQQSITDGSQKVDNLKADILQLSLESKERDENQKKEIRDLQESLDELFKLFTDTSEFQSTKIRKVYDHTVVKASEDNNTFSFLYIIVMSSSGFVLGILCMFVFSNWHTPHLSFIDTGKHALRNIPTRLTQPLISEENHTVERERRCQDDKSPVLLVIGFSDITISEHRKRVASLFPGTEDRIGVFVVKSLYDGRKISTCPLYIVFVDFNERNVILETPDLIQGELRYKTVESLCAKGEVFVVYTGDEGSKHLPAGNLYNQYLTSVRTNHLLSTLNQQSRVMSISTAFNNIQRNLIIKTFTSETNRK